MACSYFLYPPKPRYNADMRETFTSRVREHKTVRKIKRYWLTIAFGLGFVNVNAALTVPQLEVMVTLLSMVVGAEIPEQSLKTFTVILNVSPPKHL